MLTFIRFAIFLLLSFRKSFYILNTNLLLYKHIVMILSHWGLPSNFLVMTISEQKFFNFNEVQFIKIFTMVCDLYVLRNH